MRSLRSKMTGVTHTAHLQCSGVTILDFVGSPVDADSPANLQHVVGRSLGSAENLSSTLPTEGLHLALCDKSLRPTLSLRRNDYWLEVSPILRKWQSVNDASCPHCHRIIRVSMSRHLCAAHTESQCFWRCPVSSCPVWFSGMITWNVFTTSRKHKDIHSTSASANLALSGLAADHY